MKKDTCEDYWVYVFLLISIVVLWEAFLPYGIPVRNQAISTSVFFLPFTFLLIHIIDWKYSYRRAILATVFSSLSFILFFFFSSLALGKNILFSDIIGELCGYTISQLVNLFVFEFVIRRKKKNGIFLYFHYLISFLIYDLFYLFVSVSKISFEDFWFVYFFSLLLEIVVAVPFTWFDKSVQKKIS